MSLHEPTIADDRDDDGSVAGGGGNARALDADVLPEEFPDDRPLAAREYGVTEAEQARREGLDGRLRREEPDLVPDLLPDRASDVDLDDDVDDESPELLDDLDEEGGDTVKDLAALRAMPDRHDDDSGQPWSPRSAEEDAIHVVDEDALLDGDDDDLEGDAPTAG
jgi:ribosomal-protein-alanine N-acetyltransferase